jgi:hypothetical protein
MKIKLDPSQLITFGVFGAACFVLIAVVGVVWQRSSSPPVASAPSGGLAASSAAKQSSPSAPPARETSAARDSASRRQAPAELIEYLNGPVSDLLYEIERLQSDWDKDVSRNPKILILRLQSLYRRTQAAFSNLDLLLKMAAAADGRDVVDRRPLTNFASSLDDLVQIMQSVNEQDEQALRELANHPARARFYSAVGELSLWIQQTRMALAAK